MTALRDAVIEWRNAREEIFAAPAGSVSWDRLAAAENALMAAHAHCAIDSRRLLLRTRIISCPAAAL